MVELRHFAGLLIESAGFAVALWAFSRNFAVLLGQTGLPANSEQFLRVAEGQVVNLIVAGIYEELLFRHGLFGMIFYLLRMLLLVAPETRRGGSDGAALLRRASHAQRGGTDGDEQVLFLAVAGILFTGLYLARGLGIAAGAHAGYNILIGVSVW